MLARNIDPNADVEIRIDGEAFPFGVVTWGRLTKDCPEEIEEQILADWATGREWARSEGGASPMFEYRLVDEVLG
jgi:hypothetical protein